MTDGNLCRWCMTSGLICSIPITRLSSEYYIVIFQHLTPRQKIQTAYWLLTIFPIELKDLHISSIDACITFIMDHWKNGDSFYVLLDPYKFVAGGAAIDTKHSEPFISNVFTVPSARNKGFGKILMKYCEQYSVAMGFKYTKIWCDEHLIPYYIKQGYIIEKKQYNSHGNPIHIMIKDKLYKELL